MHLQPSDLLEQAKTQWPFIAGGITETHARENVVCRVPTSLGDCALRLHRPGLRSQAQLASELQFMAAMEAAGLAVPKPMQTAGGDYVALFGGTQADLLSWLPGKPLGKSRVPLAFTDEQLVSNFSDIGRAVAELHLAATAWMIPENFERPTLDLDGLLGEQPVWGSFWKLAGVEPSILGVLANARVELRKRLDALSPGLDYGLIHADVVRENILLNDGKVSFIDFDDSGFGFRVYDLATCLVKNRFEPRYAMMEKAIVEGYQSNRPLSRAEVEALPLLIAVRALSLVGWMEQRIADAGAVERRDQFLGEALTELRGLGLA